MRLRSQTYYISIPKLELTVASATESPGKEKVSVSVHDEKECYYRAIDADVAAGHAVGLSGWDSGVYTRFPLPRGADGSPWAEGVLYSLHAVDVSVRRKVRSFSSIAEDLGAFKCFADAEGIDVFDFDMSKYGRPTYRFRGFLMAQIRARTMSTKLAKRRMQSVVRFYRWLITSHVFVPKRSPWIESLVSVTITDSRGVTREITKVTTDLSIPATRSRDPLGDHIEDGGRLKPLTLVQQRAVFESLAELKNPEMTLIHSMAMLTGARTQTVLTSLANDYRDPLEASRAASVRVSCGFSTGIDTKGDKLGTLHVPPFLYRKLNVYSHSERALRRRRKAEPPGLWGHYLFLTQHGNPYYESHEDTQKLSARNERRRSVAVGQTVRMFIAARVIPLARKKLDDPTFKYTLHDLRATYGVNYVEFHNSRGIKPQTVLKDLSVLMWHSNTSVTERYLDFHSRQAALFAAEDGYAEYLAEIVSSVMGD